jgi:pyrroloquinoline quinone biosynthesis protein D
MDDVLRARPQLHPDMGLERVAGRLMAAGASDVLHLFEDDAGERSEVAERIVELSDGQRTVSGIVDALCDEFEVAREVCEADTVAFVSALVDLEILTWAQRV